ncbi:MAG: Na/Pi cotransporter family protein [Rhodobiaceae bacterium]|nr:Na/Pi cotransporter family protein [Rhodobiaceae bacterium]MCC0057345.1 Na/Pi cotransporter family protein [Rhodobiaceae bacterium]
MTLQILHAIGGLGLFLVGMHMLTEGLRGLAGPGLREGLRRSVSSPAKAAVAGALATAAVQSSSAMTVAAIGFVSAGIMTFQQALGIIFGANIGTTLTGWLVAIVGFKLDLGAALMPFVFLGALAQIFARGRWHDTGKAVAGFGILFLGITAMQDGMAFASDIVSPDHFPADSFLGRLQLVGIGVAITIVTQSSSAGVAVSLSALAAGVITFPQAAALVIGMDVGTTFSAVLATVGGSTASRRTGYAHMIYNVLTGIMAFALLWPLEWLYTARVDAGSPPDPQIALVAFHSFFNILGVLLVIGLTRQFAALVVRLVPQRADTVGGYLDENLLSDTAAAIDALSASTRALANATLTALSTLLEPHQRRAEGNGLRDLLAAREEAFLFAQRINIGNSASENALRLRSVIHALDHIERLAERCAQVEDARIVRAEPELQVLAGSLRHAIAIFLAPSGVGEDGEKRINAERHRISQHQDPYREQAIAAAGSSRQSLSDIVGRLDAVRWLHRVSYHAWRIAHHMRAMNPDAAAPATVDDRFTGGKTTVGGQETGSERKRVDGS